MALSRGGPGAAPGSWRRCGAAFLVLLGLGGCGELSEDALEAQASACPERAPLLLPGQTAPQVLLNAYYLQEEATRDVRAERAESAYLEETLAKSAALGARVIRAAAFNDGEAKIDDSAMQLAPGVYDEVSLRGMDLVLARAQAHGIQLILPLGNHWNAYGGARRYVGWAGLPDPVEGDPRFYTERAVIELFRAHLTELLSRVSTVDGIRYGDHPAVLAWELVNEPRISGAVDPDGGRLADWVDEIAQLLKSLAPGHLVGTGEEGFDHPEAMDADGFWGHTAPHLFGAGGSFRLNTASPYVDFGSVHLYPEHWGIPLEATAEAGARWISERAEVARELGKPLIVGEFGLRSSGELTDLERRAIYRGWFSCARKVGAPVFGPWLFAYDARPEAWDDYTFYYRDGTLPADPVNRYADLVVEATRPR